MFENRLLSSRSVLAAWFCLIVVAPQSAGANSPREYLRTLKRPQPPTRILVLGSPHLRILGESWKPEPLQELLGVLEKFNPGVIAVEHMPPHVIELLEKLGPNYLEVAKAMASHTRKLGHEAQELLKLDRGEAERQTRQLRTKMKTAARPEEADSLKSLLVLHLLAAYDMPSALLQWSYLSSGARKKNKEVPEQVAAELNRTLAGPNETSSIAVVLAKRLGLQELVSMDDHQEAAVTLDFWEQYSREMDSIATPDTKDSFYKSSGEKFDEAYRKGNLLPHYLWINSPGFLGEDVRHQWGTLLETRLPSQLNRSRLAQWEVRNMRMTAHIRTASALNPGSRMLVIVGVAHKPFLDAYLGQLIDVEVVQLTDIASE